MNDHDDRVGPLFATGSGEEGRSRAYGRPMRNSL